MLDFNTVHPQNTREKDLVVTSYIREKSTTHRDLQLWKNVSRQKLPIP